MVTSYSYNRKIAFFEQFWAFFDKFDVTTGLVTFGYIGYIFGYTNSEVLSEKEKNEIGVDKIFKFAILMA